MEKTGFTACREATYFSGRKLRSEEREMSLSSFVSIAFLEHRLCVRWFPTPYNSLPINHYQAGINTIILHLSEWCSYTLNREQYFFFPAALPRRVCVTWVQGQRLWRPVHPVPLAIHSSDNSFCLWGAHSSA